MDKRRRVASGKLKSGKRFPNPIERAILEREFRQHKDYAMHDGMWMPGPVEQKGLVA